MSIDLSRPSSGIGDCDSLLEGNNSDTTTPSSRNGSRYLLQRASLGTGSVDLEDSQSQMDLALNANFDIGGLFDYNWSVDEPNSIHAAAAAPLHGSVDAGSNEASDGDAKVNQVVSPPETYGTSNGTNGTLHPHAIPSSAECPPVASGVNGTLQQTLNRSSSHSQNQSGPGAGVKTGSKSSDQNPLAVSWTASLPPPVPTNMAVSNPMTAGAFFLPGTQTMTVVPPPPMASTEGAPPPFLLFDAPIELRANFIASQRAQGFPTLDDNNSFHYQRHQQAMSNATAPRLVDGRHGGIGSKRVKNEREQKRTQKITDLIDQLRDKMEEGGWKVGGTKSKYATLSTCAEFVKHLVQSNKEQELALEKTKQDLEAKRRKIEDDKEYQQDPSEPESTTSSLTISSAASTLHPPPAKQSSGDVFEDQPPLKRPRVSVRGSDDDCRHHSNTISSSNKGSSSEGTSSEGQNNRRVSSGREEASHSSSSGGTTSADVSSVGAVARGLYNRTHEINHADVIVKGRKPRSTMKGEVTSMDESFKLDYEEVFIKSNVPQLIATTAGRIVAWNDIFLKASGLLSSDMDGLTIFSLVRQTELAKLFEIVAAALRSGTMDSGEQLDRDRTDDEHTEQPEANRDVNTSRVADYTAITLPCATFRPRVSSNLKGGKGILESLLYMTVTLMKDEDPKKRCFHCLFTDCPRSSGTLGSVTPDLLGTLYTHQIS